jgi:monoterpene epsilon-lactone hydrolase
VRSQVLYLHGGGYVAGWAGICRDLTWRLATLCRVCVLGVDYRLAPEHPFPAALDDAVAAYRWLLAQGADPKRIALLGDSAGGGLVLATLLRLRDEGVALPAAAAVVSPWTDLALTGPSLHLNAAIDPVIPVELAPRVVDLCLAGADPRNPYASPLYGDPAGLPPTLILVGGDEVLRDDAVRMADRMRAAGCHVEIEIWPLMWHAWYLQTRGMREATAAIARIAAFMTDRL